jgi:ribonuclease P protein component
MRPGTQPRSFPKAARLLQRRDFVAIRSLGTGFAEGPLATSWRRRDEKPSTGSGMAGGRARVGITVSSKVGGAVVRNRVKRKIREAIRHELAALPPVDLVVVARASAVEASVEEITRWLRRAARRIEGEGQAP